MMRLWERVEGCGEVGKQGRWGGCGRELFGIVLVWFGFVSRW